MYSLQIIRRASAVVACLAFSGCQCCSNDPNPCCEVFYERPCYGYHSTCWRAWSEECMTCPPFTAAGVYAPLTEREKLPEVAPLKPAELVPPEAEPPKAIEDPQGSRTRPRKTRLTAG